MTHFQLAAGATPPTKVLQVYKPVTLTADFRPEQRHAVRRHGRLHRRELARLEELHLHGDSGHGHVDHELDDGRLRAARPGRVHDHGHELRRHRGFYTDVADAERARRPCRTTRATSRDSTLTADPLGSISATVTSAGGPVERRDRHGRRRPALDPDGNGDDERERDRDVHRAPGRLGLHGDRGQGRLRARRTSRPRSAAARRPTSRSSSRQDR